MKKKALFIGAGIVIGVGIAIACAIKSLNKKLDNMEFDFDEEDFCDYENSTEGPWDLCKECQVKDTCTCREDGKCRRADELAGACGCVEEAGACPYFKDKSTGASDGVYYS